MKIKIILLSLLILCFSLSTVSADPLPGESVGSTIGEDANCGGSCHGYYTGHFDAWFYYSNYSSTQWNVRMVEGTNVARSNDRDLDYWNLGLLTITSSGTQIYSNNSHANHRHTEVNGKHVESFTTNTSVRKGNNKISARFSYYLFDRSTDQLAEVWFPIRSRTNF